MLTFAKADFAKAMLSNIAHSNDTKTTLLGIAAGGLLTAGLDWGKLFHGDAGELGKAAGALVAVGFGYLTNKPSKK